MMEFDTEIDGIRTVVRYSFTPGYPMPADQSEPGQPDDIDPIELTAIPFEEQDRDVQEYIEGQCWNDVRDQKEAIEEAKAEAHWEKVKGEK